MRSRYLRPHPCRLGVFLGVLILQMGVLFMKLTDKACSNAKPKDKPYKMADGQGLYLFIKGQGKYWRYRYRFLNQEKTLALGIYPEVTLAEAREATRLARKTLAAGQDPMEEKRAQKRAAMIEASNRFEDVAKEWHENQREKWSEAHYRSILHRLEIDIFPHLGKRPIAEIDAPELLAVLRKVENRGAIDLAKRCRQICGQIFRYGIATGRCQHDHAYVLREALKSAKTKHYAALEIQELPAFLRALDYNDTRLYARTRRVIRILMLTFVRTGELIAASWDEIDFEAAEWRIPAERMKMRRPHVVPLSRQALALFAEQKAETGHMNTKWVFPSKVRPRDHMSNNTILGAIKRLGYQGRMTGHGFRALAMSAIKEKLGYREEVVDRQLAHAHRNKVIAAYDRAQFLDDRKKMMQEWADYIDTIYKP